MGSLAPEIIAERRALADTAARVGPDAPTGAGSWTSADVVAHVVSLDSLAGVPTFLGRTVVERWALRLNDLGGRFADAGIRATRRRGFEWAVECLRSAPPRLLLRPGVSTVGLFEVFVHHEDVRRASVPYDARPAPGGLVAAVPWLLRYHRSVLPEVALVIRAGARSFRAGAGPEVVVVGELAEVVLWLAGRVDAAHVALEGDPDAIDRLRRSAIRI